MTTKPTEDELRAAYVETTWRDMGIDVETALTTPHLRRALEGLLKAKRKWTQTQRITGSRSLEHLTSEE